MALSKAVTNGPPPPSQGGSSVRETYVDLEVLAEVDQDDYVVRISKTDFNTLVTYACSSIAANENADAELVVRHWDGNQPVVLEAYGSTAVRTRDDFSADNNLENLPRISSRTIEKILG